MVKHFPLSNHEFAYEGALAALAAGRQGKFWEFHGRLLEHYNAVTDEKIAEIAAGLQLNMDQFNADRQSADSQALIAADIENGQAAGVRGTPTLFMNGKRIRNQDLGSLPDLIRRELAR